MKIYRPLVLDFSKKNYNNTVLASQFDTLSRYVDITLIDNNVPVDITNHTVRIYAKKPDWTRVFNDAEIIDATNGKVRVELTNQILAVTGLVECELTLYGTDGSIIASQKFYINVGKTLRDDSAIESTNEFTALTNALNDIEQAKADVGVVGSLNDELENNINIGTQLKTDLDVNIQTGTQLKADLETDITTATQKKTELENVIATADTTTYATKEEITTINSQLEDNTNKIGILNEHLAEKVTLASYQPTKKVRYIAHRGMSAIAPENTIPAYELAGELGMWGAECDVTTTKDGAWVLMHDNTVDRTTNGTGKVSDFTLDEIKNLKIDAGNNVELYPNLRVPTLEEYLITCKKYGLMPVIEIKLASKNSDYDTFVNLIKKYGYEEICIVISFSLTALQEVRLRNKKIVIQYLADISETTINQVQELRNAGLDVNHAFLTKEKIELAHSNGLMINTWTVNSVQTAKNLTDLGVDYITTDVLIEVI